MPEYAPHHAAKHELVRHYMDAWLPKLGFTNAQVVVVDAFASAGRYRDGRSGSPLILLDAFLSRADRDRFRAPPHFVLLEPRLGFARHLRAEVDALELYGASVDVIRGSYEDEFPRVVEHLAKTYRQPLPTFLFVDPRGFRDNPFSHIRLFKKTLPAKTEAMVYLPVAFMARFGRTGITDAAMDSLFDEEEWRPAVTQATRREVSAQLGDAFRDLMRECFTRVTAFTVDPVRHNDYYLLFGTDHRDGLRAMKTAMWKVDKVSGSGYQQMAAAAAGAMQLFGDEEVAHIPHEDTLPALLRARFGTDTFTVEEAEDFTLEDTRYIDRPHLRSLALVPLQDAGKLKVVSSSRRRERDFPDGTIMRFVE